MVASTMVARLWHLRCSPRCSKCGSAHALSGFRTSFLHSFFYNVPQTVVAIELLELDAAQAGLACAIGVFVQLWDHVNAEPDIGELRLRVFDLGSAVPHVRRPAPAAGVPRMLIGL